MKIICIQHTRHSDVTLIQRWADEAKYQLVLINAARHDQSTLPDLTDIAGVISMGGPQRACFFEQHPELMQEVEWLQLILQHDIPVLGICLGAQLLGYALGQAARRSPEVEFGYYPVALNEIGREDPVFSAFTSPFYGLQWHYDMIGVPDEAEILAASKGCPVQAVRFRDRVYGVQFHWDFSRKTLIRYLQQLIDHVPVGSYVQTAAEMLQADFAQMESDLFMLLSRVFR